MSVIPPYKQALEQARLLHDTVLTPQQYQLLAKAWADAIADSADFLRNMKQFDAASAQQLEIFLTRRLRRLSTLVGDNLEAGISQTVRAFRDAHKAGLLGNTSGKVVRGLVRNLQADNVMEQLVLRQGLAGGSAKFYKTLIRRRISWQSGNAVDSMLQRWVGVGINTNDAINELAGTFASADPVLKDLMEKTGRFRRRELKQLAKSPAELKAIRSAYYDSRRIVRSDVRNAGFEADIQAAALSPAVDLLEWEVSGNHDSSWSTPDICTYYRDADTQGYGPGRFHPSACPVHPHPDCGCRVRKIFRPAEEWDNPKRPIPAQRDFTQKEVRETLANSSAAKRNGRDLSKAHVRSTARVAKEDVHRAISYGRGRYYTGEVDRVVSQSVGRPVDADILKRQLAGKNNAALESYQMRVDVPDDFVASRGQVYGFGDQPLRSTSLSKRQIIVDIPKGSLGRMILPDGLPSGASFWESKVASEIYIHRGSGNKYYGRLVDDELQALITKKQTAIEETSFNLRSYLQNRSTKWTGIQNLPEPKINDTENWFKLPNGEWGEARKALHEEIIARHLKGLEVSKDRTVMMMGGGPASGKSSIIKQGKIVIDGKQLTIGKVDGLDRVTSHSMVYLDADQIKGLLPEYRELSKFFDGAAAMAHEESSYLVKEITRRAQAKGYDVVLDAVADGGLNKVLSKVDEFRKAGYKVTANYVSVDTEIALIRNWERYLRTGRLVPSQFVEGAHRDISQWIGEAARVRMFDDLKIWDTTGTPALSLHARKGVAALDALDKDKLRSILSKGLDPEDVSKYIDSLIEHKAGIEQIAANAFKFTREDLVKFDAAHRKLQASLADSLTASQRRALESYKETGYIDINKTLRKQPTYAEAAEKRRIARWIKSIDSVFDDPNLSVSAGDLTGGQALTVTRFTTDATLFGSDIEALFYGLGKKSKAQFAELVDAILKKKGKVVRDRAYVSTTYSPLYERQGAIRMEIDIPKDMRGILLDIGDGTRSEYELLLQKGLSMYVYDVIVNQKTLEVIVKLRVGRK